MTSKDDTAGEPPGKARADVEGVGDARLTAGHWHTSDIDTVFDALGVRRAGLSDEESTRRLARFGPNALPQPRTRGVLARLLSQFDNLLIAVLLVAGAITALLGHWTDAAVILAAVLLNAAVGFWQEGKAQDALAAARYRT